MLILNLLIIVVGFAALLKGADVFVDGSSGLARRFHVSDLIIGLTIVSMGTSAPELAVSTVAAISGSNEIALSNVIGSNTFNLLVVLGICAMIKALPVDKAVLKRDYPISILAALFVLILAVGKNALPVHLGTAAISDNAGIVTRVVGIALLAGFAAYIVFLIVTPQKTDWDDAVEPLSLNKSIIFIVLGLVMIIVGGQAVVYSAKNIARAAGLTETLIGLTIVAIGTSLPELVTSVVAAGKGETGLAVGNVLGSNIFNNLFILGVSSTIHPVAVNYASVYDLILLIVLSIIAYIMSATNKKIIRVEGFVMVACYCCYMVYVIKR